MLIEIHHADHIPACPTANTVFCAYEDIGGTRYKHGSYLHWPMTEEGLRGALDDARAAFDKVRVGLL